MNTLFIFIIAAATLVITFASGFLFLRALTNLSTEECWAFNGAAGCALLGSISFLAFLMGQFQREFYISVLLVVLLICLVTIRLRKIQVFITRPPSWVFTIFVFWVCMVAFQCLTSIYTRAFMYADWWMHFDLTQFYLGLRPMDVHYFGVSGVPSRTPLFNLFASFFLATFVNQFYVYQLVALIPGVALVTAALIFIPARRIPMTLYLFFLNPFLVTMTLYPWPKLLTATYVIAGIYFYIRWRSDSESRSSFSPMIISGVWQSLAILTHPSAILYTLGIVMDNMFARQPSKNRFSWILVSGLSIALVMLPWFLWVNHNYGLTSVLQASPTVAADHEGMFSQAWWNGRVTNTVGTLLPLTAMIALIEQRTDLSLWLDVWLRFFYGMLPAACTFTVLSILWRQLKIRAHALLAIPLRTFAIIIAVGFFGGIFLQPDSNLYGVTGESMAPIVVIVLIIAAHSSDAFSPQQQKWIVWFGVLEFLVSRGLQTLVTVAMTVPASDKNLLLKVQNHLLFARDIIQVPNIIFIFMIVAGYSFIVRRSLQHSISKTAPAEILSAP